MVSSRFVAFANQHHYTHVRGGTGTGWEVRNLAHVVLGLTRLH